MYFQFSAKRLFNKTRVSCVVFACLCNEYPFVEFDPKSVFVTARACKRPSQCVRKRADGHLAPDKSPYAMKTKGTVPFIETLCFEPDPKVGVKILSSPSAPPADKLSNPDAGPSKHTQE